MYREYKYTKFLSKIPFQILFQSVKLILKYKSFKFNDLVVNRIQHFKATANAESPLTVHITRKRKVKSTRTKLSSSCCNRGDCTVSIGIIVGKNFVNDRGREEKQERKNDRRSFGNVEKDENKGKDNDNEDTSDCGDEADDNNNNADDSSDDNDDSDGTGGGREDCVCDKVANVIREYNGNEDEDGGDSGSGCGGFDENNDFA
ncbi:Hypothetical predicted protein [Octopus vulgaris]|uniref:Uncharacterized protein n=1 Tax=Octopus vulgaris TaxID=6645 RepID=A0AA36ALY2_OCTVU|nr:Hypothetical predicted protein [Octopus vulgaris]